MNLGILGTGRVADSALAPALHAIEGVHLWSVLSRDGERAKVFASKHGARAPVPAYGDLDEMLADPRLDAVLIATPDAMHARQANAAFRAGKHVLAEKPMATDLAQAQAMVAESRAAGLRLAVGYHMRWHSAHRAIARRCHAGDFGELRHIRVHWSHLARSSEHWRTSPMLARWWSLAALGTHGLDQILWLMAPTCGEVMELKSVVDRSVWRSPHDETVVLCLRFESGATAELCCSVAFAAPSRMEIYGSRAYAICDDTFGFHGHGAARTDRGPLEFAPANPFVGEIQDFVAAITDARDPEVPGEVGLRNIKLMTHAITDDLSNSKNR